MTDKKARHESRVLAVETLFAFLERDQEVKMDTCFTHVLKDVEERNSDDFARELLKKTEENLSSIKVLIKSFASEFPFEKIAPINRAILFLGITEMKHFDTPPVVVINEYIELAKAFGEEKSAPFVNAVLDGFRESIGKEREGKSKK